MLFQPGWGHETDTARRQKIHRTSEKPSPSETRKVMDYEDGGECSKETFQTKVNKIEEMDL